jgi:hypothetical protein
MSEHIQQVERPIWAAKLGPVSWLSICEKPWWMFWGSRTTMYRSFDDGQHWHEIIAPGETMCVMPQVAAELRRLYQVSAPSPTPEAG